MPRKHRRAGRPEAPARSTPASRTGGPTWAELAGFEVREVRSDKPYRCPGCDHVVRAGARHLVVVPVGDVDARRHWHTECWRRELRRLGTHRDDRDR